MKTLKLLIIGLAVLCLVPSFAQTRPGSLKGKVSDLVNMETIPFANIVLKDEKGGVIAGGASDFDGMFNITPVKAGSYKVEVSFTGYETETFQEVQVSPNTETTLNVFLNEGSYELIECVITCNLPEIENTRSCCITTCCGWSSSCYVYGPELTEGGLDHDAFGLFPNPSTGKINVKTDLEIEKVHVTNMNGKTVAEIDVNHPNDVSANLSHLPAATYVVHFSDGRSQKSQLWILQH